MALNEQMKEAIQADIADESSKKERLAKQVEGLKSTGKFIGETAVESIPGVSEGIAVRNVSRDLKEGDYVGAGIETLAGLAGLAPAGGDVLAKGLRKFNNTRKAYKVAVQAEDKKLYPLFVNADKELPVGQWIEADFPDTAFTAPNGKVYVPSKGAKRTKGEKTKGTGDQVKIPDEETAKKLKDAGFSVSKPTKNAPHGTVLSVAARPGLHASQSPVATHLGPEDLIVTDSEKKKLLNAGVTPEAFISKTFFYDKNNKIVGRNKRKNLSEAELSELKRKKVNYIKRRAEDHVFVEVDMADDVDYQSMLLKEGKSDINDFVPRGGSYKYSDGQADSDQWVVGGDMKINRVLSREEARAIQKEMGVVDLPYRDEVEAILGRKFSKGGVVMDDYIVAKLMDNETPQQFAEGGMTKQMDLFEPVERGFDDGGLMDEGGSVDPESGNDVPVGSTQEEVRDDIPAQLSEGEFVLPADVVRYHGLEKIMALRDEAKAGLAKMEAMGQMGNSEEATIPDGIPFSMDDLEMEDDGVQDFAQGGVVQAQAGTFVSPNLGIYQQPSQVGGYQPQYTPYTPPVMPAGQPMAQQYTPVQQQAVPTITQQAPTFTGFTGSAAPSPGGYDEMKTYVNDAGMEMQIPFKDGSPIYPIPEGYKLKGEAVQTTQTTTTTDTGVETARDTGDDNETDPFAGKQTVNLGGTAVKEFIREGLNTYEPGQVKGSTKYAVGTASSVTGDLSKTGITGSIKDTVAGMLNQDQRTLTDELGNTVAMSKGMYDTLVSEHTSNYTNSVLQDIFEIQKTIEQKKDYSKDLDNRQAKQLAKELGMKYKGQSLAEIMVVNKEAFEAEEIAEKAAKEQQQKAAQEKGAEKREERERAAADAEQYGISDTNLDGSKKSASEIRSEIADAVTAQALEKERQAAARRSQRGDDDDGAPDQSTYAGSQAYGAETFGISGLAKGGLTKQMEKSGLTPKK